MPFPVIYVADPLKVVLLVLVLVLDVEPSMCLNEIHLGLSKYMSTFWETMFSLFMYICNFWLLSVLGFSSDSTSSRPSLTFYLEFDKVMFLVLRRNSNGVYFAQVIRFVRVCIYITDINMPEIKI